MITESRKIMQVLKRKLFSGTFSENEEVFEKDSISLSFFDFVRKYRPEFSYDEGYSYLKYPLQLAMNGQRHIIFCKGSQVGVTEAFLGFTLWSMKENRKNIFYMLPTSGEVSDFSAARLNSVLEDNPDLKSSFSFDNVHHKKCGRANLYLRGGNSPSLIKSVPVSLLIVDEIDEIPASSIDIVRERLSGSLEKQEINISTPTLPDVGIWREYIKSIQHNYFIFCPHCNFEQHFVWENNVDLIKEKLICSSCKKEISHEDKIKSISQGTWKITNDQIEFTIKDSVSFHVNQLYSPSLTIEEIVKNYKNIDGETKKSVFFNHKLGLPYIVEGARLSGELIDSRRGFLKTESHRFLGIDVSQTSLHYCVEISTHEAGIVVENVLRLAWEDVKKYCVDKKIKGVVIDANPERHSARKLQESLENIECYIALYPNIRQLIELDEKNLIVKISRTEIIDIIFNRFKDDHILIQENLAEYEKFKFHLTGTVRQYREKKEGVFEAFYQELNDDHYLHALCYAEVASRIVGNFEEKIEERFV